MANKTQPPDNGTNWNSRSNVARIGCLYGCPTLACPILVWGGGEGEATVSRRQVN